MAIRDIVALAHQHTPADAAKLRTLSRAAQLFDEIVTARRVLTSVLSPYALNIGTDPDVVLVCDTTGGAITVNLPKASTASGRHLWVKKHPAAANAVTLAPYAGDTVDGGASLSLPAATLATAHLVSDGASNWHVLNSSGFGGMGAAAGANGDVQYNNAGVLGAEAAFNYDAAANRLAVENVRLSSAPVRDAMAWCGTFTSVPSTTGYKLGDMCQVVAGAARADVYQLIYDTNGGVLVWTRTATGQVF